VYGDVSRVKIMFNKKDTALVQFADPGQAQIGKLSSAFLRYLFKAVFSILLLNQFFVVQNFLLLLSLCIIIYL